MHIYFFPFDRKKSRGGHTLSIQTTTIRLTPKEALREGKKLIDDAISQNAASAGPTDISKMHPKTEFNVQIVPSTKRSSSRNSLPMSHSEVENQVLVSLATIEAKEFPTVKLRHKSATSQELERRYKSASTRKLERFVSEENRRKSTTYSERNLTSQTLTKNLNKSKSSLSLSSRMKEKSKLNSSLTHSPPSSTSLQESSSHRGPNSQKSPQRTALSKNRKSLSLDTENVKVSESSKLPEEQGKSSVSENIHSAQSLTSKGTHISKIVTPSSKNILLSQGISGQNKKQLSGMLSQRSKSEAYVNGAVHTRRVSGGGSTQQTLSKRLVKLSSPKKVMVSPPERDILEKTYNKGSLSRLPSKRNLSKKAASPEASSLPLGENLTKSKIPLSKRGTSIRQKDTYDKKLHDQKRKSLTRKHTVPQYPISAKNVEKNMIDKFCDKIDGEIDGSGLTDKDSNLENDSEVCDKSEPANEFLK